MFDNIHSIMSMERFVAQTFDAMLLGDIGSDIREEENTTSKGDVRRRYGTNKLTVRHGTITRVTSKESCVGVDSCKVI